MQKQSSEVYSKKRVFCEICETFKNTYFEEHLARIASITDY